MRSIQKLEICVTDKNTVSEHLKHWQTEINASSSDCQSFVEQSQQADADGTALWKSAPKKSGLRAQLYIEQKGLCCYCGQQLGNYQSVIVEHLNPKSRFPMLTFDYKNLYGSCRGVPLRIDTYYPKKVTTIKELAKEHKVPDDCICIPNKPNAERADEIPANTKVNIRHYDYHQKEGSHCDHEKDKRCIQVQPIVSDQRVCNQHKPEHDYDVLSCDNRISFSEDGKIKIEGNANHETITTLNLNVPELKDARKKIYEEVAEFIFSLEEDTQEMMDLIQARIISIEQQTEQESFAFVSVYFLQEKIEELS